MNGFISIFEKYNSGVVKVSFHIVMAGRKRKMLAMAAMVTTPEQQVNKLKNHATDVKLKVSGAEVKDQKQVQCGNSAQSADTERSHYFTTSDLQQQQHRLGQDFFNQPCIALAKAFLGKVPALLSVYIDSIDYYLLTP